MTTMFGIDSCTAPNEINSRFVVFLKDGYIKRLDKWFEELEKGKIVINEAVKFIDEKGDYKKWLLNRLALYYGFVWCKRTKAFVTPDKQLRWCKYQRKWVVKADLMNENPKESMWRQIELDPGVYAPGDLKQAVKITNERDWVRFKKMVRFSVVFNKFNKIRIEFVNGKYIITGV